MWFGIWKLLINEFNHLKNILKSKPVLHDFDDKKDTIQSAASSKNSLGTKAVTLKSSNESQLHNKIVLRGKRDLSNSIK